MLVKLHVYNAKRDQRKAFPIDSLIRLQSGSHFYALKAPIH